MLANKYVLLTVSLAFIIGCGEDENKYQAPPPPAVTVSQPIQQEVTDFSEYSGKLSAIESVDLRARVVGYLTKVAYKASATVKKGDLLFEIDPQPYEVAVKQAEAALLARKAQVTLDEATLARYKEAFSKGAGTEFEVLEAQGKLDATKASVIAAEAALEEAKINLGYTKVYSPFDGMVDRNFVDVGNLVGAGEPTLLSTILQLNPIYANFAISERDLLAYKELRRQQKTAATPRELAIYIGLDSEQGFPHKGMFDSASNKINPATGTIDIRGVFPNDQRLLYPGMNVRVMLPLGQRKAMLVPDVAVNTDQLGKFLLVVNDKNEVEIKRVKTGRVHEGLQVIESGLNGDEWVVVKGVQRARPGSVVNPTKQEISQTAPATRNVMTQSATGGSEN